METPFDVHKHNYVQELKTVVNSSNLGYASMMRKVNQLVGITTWRQLLSTAEKITLADIQSEAKRLLVMDSRCTINTV